MTVLAGLCRWVTHICSGRVAVQEPQSLQEQIKEEIQKLGEKDFGDKPC